MDIRTSNGYARTQYADDPWWFQWCAKYLGSRKAMFPTDGDLIRFRIVAGVLHFTIIESKCLRGRTMKTHQQKTFCMLHQQLTAAVADTAPLTFTMKGKTYTYPVKYAGFFLCNSYACDNDCNDLYDVWGNPCMDETGILLGEAHNAKIDFIPRDRNFNWMMVIRRFTGEGVDDKTAFILRVMEALIRRFEGSEYSKKVGSTFFTDWHNIDRREIEVTCKFHGLHLLEYDRPDLDRAKFRWDGKPASMQEVVKAMTYGKIANATQPEPIKPILTLKS